jgi:four helix bundle protein
LSASRGAYCTSGRYETLSNRSARNISEGFGRGTGRDRDRSLEIARGEAEEAIRHLSANFRSKRIAPQEYWPVHDLLVVIVKMLNSLVHC